MKYLSKKYSISVTSISKYVNSAREHDGYNPGKKSCIGTKTRLTDEEIKIIKKVVLSKPVASILEYREMLMMQGLIVAQRTILKYIFQLGFRKGYVLIK